MNSEVKQTKQTDGKENVVAGIVGAFLFSLAGGLLWFVLYQFGFLAGISGLVGVVCAIKGYTLFGKKESIKGIIIAVIIALLVMVIAWYFCLSYDVFDIYKHWYETGEIDYRISFAEAVRGARFYLQDPEVGPAYFKDLAIGLVFCVIGGGSYVMNKISGIRKQKPQVVTQAPKTESDDTQEKDS